VLAIDDGVGTHPPPHHQPGPARSTQPTGKEPGAYDGTLSIQIRRTVNSSSTVISRLSSFRQEMMSPAASFVLTIVSSIVSPLRKAAGQSRNFGPEPAFPCLMDQDGIFHKKNPLIFPEQFFHCIRQRKKIVLDRLPQYHGTYREIPMDHLVPHPRKFFPGNIRVAFDKIRRDFLNRFPDNHEIENDCLAGFTVAKQLLIGYDIGIGNDRGD
jgi:hypothetical protein